MLRHHALFQYISSQLFEKNQSELFKAIREMKTQEGAPYLLLFLPKDSKTKILIQDKALILNLHHVSIYSDYKAFSENSEYHYTARLSSIDKEVLELHVYFDKNGKRLGKPSLKKLENFGKIKTTINISEEEAEILTEIASMHASKALVALQNEHQKHQAEYEAKIIQLLNEMHSSELTDISLIDSLTDKADALKPYIKTINNELYETTLFELIDSLEWEKAYLLQNSAASLTYIQPGETKIESTPEISAEIVTISNQQQPVATKALKTSQSINTTIDQLFNRYRSLSMGKATDKSEIEEYLELYSEAELLYFEMLTTKINTPKTSKISVLCLKIQKQCTQLLLDALSTHNFTDALKLQKFIKYLPHSSIVNAVKSKNIEEIKLLLKFGSFPIDQISCNHENQTYSLLEYAYISNDLECFSELLAKGSSIFTSFSDSTPLVSKIIKDKTSPFYKQILTRYSGKQLIFLQKQLALIMEKEGNHEASEILKYDSLIAAQLPATTFSSDTLNRCVEVFALPAEKQKQLNEIIERSPQLQKIIIQFQEAQLFFIESIPKKYKNNIHKNFEEILCNMKNTSPEDLCLEEDKIIEDLTTIINSTTDRIKIFQLKEEIEILQNKNKNKNLTYNQAKKKNKELKALRDEHNQLVESLITKGLKFMLPPEVKDLSEELKNLLNALEKIENILKDLPPEHFDQCLKKAVEKSLLTSLNNRLLSKLAVESEVRDDSERRTVQYMNRRRNLPLQ